MSADEERRATVPPGLSLRQSGQTDAGPWRYASGAPASTRVRRDPAVPADIVARARTAIRQANGANGDVNADGRSATISGAIDGSDEAAEPSLTDLAQAARIEPPPSSNAKLTSGVEECPPGPEEATGTAQGRSPDAWPGYDPDFVADQLVPMIRARRATTGWRSWFGLPPSRSELDRKDLQAAMCVNFGRPIKIVVANPRGSAGKTTVTVTLGGTLGSARGGRVCALELHELRGVMSLLTSTNGTSRTTRDFINDLSTMTPEQVRHADLSRYLRHQSSGNFDAMVTSRNAQKQLDGDEYRAASLLLERFYEVIVIDTANNEAHDAFRAAVEDATVLVVPTKWRPTHITPAAQMLHDMAAASPRHQILVRNAVIAATNGVNEAAPGARDSALPMFQSLAYEVVEIPPDPHIEEDGPIIHDQLLPTTRAALDRLGAAVCQAAVKNVRETEEL